MIKISIQRVQPKLNTRAIAAILLETGMSDDESDYYANEIVRGSEFEIDAPDTALVKQMISALQDLGVNLTFER